ncbi:MAG: UxaA family hydrolase [Phototrophicaceae bacterium]
MTPKTCFQIHPTDNVAVLLEDAAAGETVTVIGETTASVTLHEPIVYGHKVALKAIAAGDPVMKYGIRIGTATVDIQPGQTVHLHNCASDFDERSGQFDPHTGAAIDTAYH